MSHSAMAPIEMARRIGSGLLSFPVTPFTPALAFDERRYRDNLDWLAGYDVAGLFAAGGTGEFFSLTPAEVARVVAVAVEQVRGKVPVLAGVGYGTAIAKDLAVAAERARRRWPAAVAALSRQFRAGGPCRARRGRVQGDQTRRHRLQPRQRNVA